MKSQIGTIKNVIDLFVICRVSISRITVGMEVTFTNPSISSSVFLSYHNSTYIAAGQVATPLRALFIPTGGIIPIAMQPRCTGLRGGRLRRNYALTGKFKVRLLYFK